MNSKSLRRLAADHGSLYTAGLPPNYLFPSTSDGSADLTSLDILLAGPIGTPYAGGVWRLHLDIPPTYPAAPPTAQFRTPLWHPNIDEATGAVCVETLKRDWSSTLKLRDVLVTISCLLIQPNPASALNETAGKLASEDWATYCRRATLMTNIHAAVPNSMAQEVKDAQMRGEEGCAEPEPEPPAVKRQRKGKDTECSKTIPSASKLQPLAAEEDEENAWRRGETQEPESDMESDWIPGPDRSLKVRGTQRENNIFGIKGLDDTMQLNTLPKRIFVAPTTSSINEKRGDRHVSDPFITVTSKRTAHTTHLIDLRVPSASDTRSSQDPHSLATSTVTPHLLKFSSQNPFSAIQPNNQTHSLFREFSHSWEYSSTLHNTSLAQAGTSKLDARKRMAGEDFEQKKTWEIKRFRKAGYDLGRYNRGDWGPRTGIGRL